MRGSKMVARRSTPLTTGGRRASQMIWATPWMTQDNAQGPSAHHAEPPGSDDVMRTSGGRADMTNESDSGDGPRTESKKGTKGAREADDNGRGPGKPHKPARQPIGSQFDRGGELTGWKRDERVAHEHADAETHREAIRTCRLGVQDEGERSATY